MLLLFKNKEDREISHLNVNLKHYGKYQFVLKLIQLPTFSNLDLYPLKVVNFVYYLKTRILRIKCTLYISWLVIMIILL